MGSCKLPDITDAVEASEADVGDGGDTDNASCHQEGKPTVMKGGTRSNKAHLGSRKGYRGLSVLMFSTLANRLSSLVSAPSLTHVSTIFLIWSERRRLLA